MKPIQVICLSLVVMLCAYLAWHETAREKIPSGAPDGCILCHTTDTDPSPAHPVAVMGCAVCHIGNPFARDKQSAHTGLIRNPGDLRLARKTCGQAPCHPDLPQRVEKSLMATNRGILTVMQTLWPHEKATSVYEPVGEPIGDVRLLLGLPASRSPALDHYRKMCAGCHLWRPRYPRLGEIGRRGGGCTDCHVRELEAPNPDLSQKKFRHPGLTTRIPDENCLKCHNRSARIGLSYHGRFESEGYGTPYHKGAPNPRRFSGGRFYLELPGDVHHRKAGLGCIDCHTETGVMGDGKAHRHQEEQVDIACDTCHQARLESQKVNFELYQRLVRANGRQPPGGKGPFVVSPKGSPLYHLRPDPGGRLKLYRKQDGLEIGFNAALSPATHKAPYHRRLSCQACHSAWTPQCYGCHEMLFRGASQKGWLTGKKSKGRWVEGRSYLRFQRPTLAVNADGQIGPVAPGCQVYIDVFDPQGGYLPEKKHRHLVMAGFDPHTTARKTPDCANCHLDPKILGLGIGSLKVTPSGLIHDPVYQARASGLGIDFPLDGFVAADGCLLQRPSRQGSRPFNREELDRITRTALCIPCHDRYDDKIYQEGSASFSRFMAGETPCRRVP